MKLSELIVVLTGLQAEARGQDPVVVVQNFIVSYEHELPSKLSDANFKMYGDGESLIVLRINVPPKQIKALS